MLLHPETIIQHRKSLLEAREEVRIDDLWRAVRKEVMTRPFLTTVTDFTGVSIHLGLSTLFLTRILG